MKRAIIHLFFLLLPTIVYSAPEISDITGTVITGTGLEANTSPEPIEWLGDNIEDGTTDGAFTKTGWTVSGGNGSPVYTDTESHSGTQSIYYDLQGLDYGDREGAAESNVGNNDELFMSVWVKLSLVLAGDCNEFQWKTFRFSNETGYNVDTTNFANLYWYKDLDGWSNNGFLKYVDHKTDSQSQAWGLAGADILAWDTWQRMDIHLVHSTPNVSDGSIEWARLGYGTLMGGTSGDPKTATMTRTIPTDYFSFVRLQAYMLSLSEEFDGETKPDCSDTDTTNSRMQVYYDDVYISDTQARVELCDTDTWAARNICEVQLLTHRTDSSITFTENQGGFILNDNVFAYVVDSNGEVNQTGTLYTITGNSTPPPSGYPVYCDGASIITGD